MFLKKENESQCKSDGVRNTAHNRERTRNNRGGENEIEKTIRCGRRVTRRQKQRPACAHTHTSTKNQG